MEIITVITKPFLHNDFAHLLFGSGLVGSFLYLSILFFLIKKSVFVIKLDNSILKFIGTGSLILVAAIIISGLGDGILSVQNRIVPFYTLGLFLGYARNKKFMVS